MSIFHIWPEDPVLRNGKLILSAALETPDGRETLWYKLPEEQKESISPNADPFLIGAVYRYMECGYDVKVHGTVSPSLIRNLEEFQAAWNEWRPDDLKRVRINADHEEETVLARDNEEAVISFSGGVDSCFTAFRHARAVGVRFPYKIKAATMVQGFDIPLDDDEGFLSSVERSRLMLNSLDIEMIPVSTNFRELVKDWSHSFGSALISCVSFLSGRFSAGLIAQGLRYDECSLLHEGSNPLTDALLSSDNFKVVPDGTGFSRAEKISVMREWDEFLRYLRVCWQGSHRDRNCCVCEKCIRNILEFRILGLGLPPCFEHDVNNEQIRTMNLGGKYISRFRYTGMAERAIAAGVDDEWPDIIEKKLAAKELKGKSHGLKLELKHMLSRFRKAPLATLGQTLPRMFTQ